MAVEVTDASDVVVVQSSSASGSQNVAIPATATCVVVAISLYNTSTNWIAANPVSLGGTNLTTLQKTDEQTDDGHVWIGYIINPTTGASVSFAWGPGAAPTEGATYVIIPLKGVDTINPILDSDQSLTTGDISGLTAETGSLMIGISYVYNTTADVDSDGQTVLASGVYNSAGYGVASKAGGTSFSTDNDSYSSAVAVSLKAGSFAYIAKAEVASDAGGTQVDCTTDLNVQAGDLLVAVCRWYGTDTTATLAEAGGGNSFTMSTRVANGSGGFLRMGYKIGASADATFTMRLTLGASQTYVAVIVYQFRPSRAPTVDASDKGNTGTGTTPQSANFDTTGTDELVVGGHSPHNWDTMSSFQIADTAADGSEVAGTSSDYLGICFKVFTSVQTGIHTQNTQASSVVWAADALAFRQGGVLKMDVSKGIMLKGFST